MITLFRYNWQVRDEWFQLLEKFTHEELTSERIGGLGSMLKTLFHIVDVEQSWINGLNGKQQFHYNYEEHSSLIQIKELSDRCRPNVKEFIETWRPEFDTKPFYEFTYGEVFRHVIAHEIHHVGQLSVWARELRTEPVTANLILRGLF